MTKHIIYSREKFEYNTDPQGRCYDGYFYSSEWRWSSWERLGSAPTKEEADASVASWRSIGRKTCEFKAVPEGEEP